MRTYSSHADNVDRRERDGKRHLPVPASRNGYAVLVIMLTVMAVGAATAGPGTPPPTGANTQPPNTKPKAGFFRDKNGVITITNRPEKYQRNKDYEPVEIKYEPVVVPDRYRRLPQATRQSAASIKNLVTRYARQNKLDPNLVHAVIKAESNFAVNAQSDKGACGLMQLMPGTAADMGVTSIFDPAQNIAGGTQYLAKLLKLFRYDKRKALAAYNAGPSIVKRYDGMPPYAETQDYVRDVLAYAAKFAREGIGTAVMAEAGAETPRTSVSVAKPTPKKPEKKCYTIQFNSGLSQPADEVDDEGPYYRIKYGNRVDFIRKEHVKQIVAPA